MPLPITFGTQTAAHLGDLDTQFAAVALLTVLPCTIAGTNALTLTLLSTPSTPTVTAYQNYMAFVGIAVNANTGATTAAAGSLAALSVYRDTTASGPVVLSGGEIQPNNLIWLLYDSALNSGAGGFHLQTAPLAASGTVTSLVAGTGLAGGTITTTGTISTAAITNQRVMANISGGSAAPSANTLTTIFDSMLGTVTYGMALRGTSTWSTVGGIAAALSAAGATQGTATPASVQYNVFTTVGAGQGGILAGPVGLSQFIFNQGANSLLLYPPVGGQLDGLGTNNPATIVTTGKAGYIQVSSTQAYSLP